MQAHVEHLIAQADAYAAKDYARSDALYRESYAHTFDLGHTLAATLLPPDQAAALDQPSWRLRSALDRLLGEHVALAVGALRAGGTNSPDFPAAADALNGNTRDLAAAMGTLFGAQAGQQFMSLWADHVDQLVAYTTGVAGNDGAKRDGALARLRDFEGSLAAFLDSATGSKMHSADLAKAFLAHDQMLTQQVDAFAGRDFPRAHDLAYTTYQDMFGLSGQLADAFGETVAARLPHGGAQTGAGGTAGRPGSAGAGEGAAAAGRRPWSRSRCASVTAVAGSQAAAGRTAAVRRGIDAGDGRRRPARSGRCAATPTSRSRSGCASRRPGSTRRWCGWAGPPTARSRCRREFDVAGWFAEGPRPGQPGPAVVLGHVDSRTGPAVFYRVAALPRDAQVVVDRADGSTVAFRVSSTQRVPKVDFPTDGCTARPSSRRCGW